MTTQYRTEWLAVQGLKSINGVSVTPVKMKKSVLPTYIRALTGLIDKTPIEIVKIKHKKVKSAAISRPKRCS